MNEGLFFFAIFAVLAFVLWALRLGKTALVALIALQGVLANLFVIKQMSCFGLSITCSDVFSIGGMLALNLLQEYFGKEEAVKAVKASLLALLFFALMAQVHLWYVPSFSDTTQGAFSAVLGYSPRIVAASLFSFYWVQRFDVRFFGWVRGDLRTRVMLSLFLSQFIDTVLFSVLGLYGLVESLVDIILVSFLVKCVMIVTSGMFVGLYTNEFKSGFWATRKLAEFIYRK